MNRKLILFVLVVGVFSAFVASCQNESEENRAVVTIASINGNIPFFSDVIEQGDTLYFPAYPTPYLADDFVREDFVVVGFYNRPYNNFTTTGVGKPLSDFLVTRYLVEYRRADGGPADEVPPTFEGATSVLVPSNSLVEAAVLLCPYEAKNTSPLWDISYLGALWPDEILTIATITFWGHEVGTNREWSFQASLTVNFADPVVETKDDF